MRTNMKDTLTRRTEPAGNGIEHTNGAEHDMQVTGLTESDPGMTYAAATILTPRRRPWRAVLAIVLAVLVVAAVAWWRFSPTKSQLSATVTRGTIVSTVETTGKLEAQTSAKLSFRTSGQVVNVLAHQGDSVEEGEVIAELDTAQLRLNLAEANTQLEISKLKLQQAKDGARPEDVAAAAADLDAAIARLDNARGGGRAEDIAAATAALNQAQAKLDAVKKGASPQDIEQAQATLQQAQARLQAVK